MILIFECNSSIYFMESNRHSLNEYFRMFLNETPSDPTKELKLYLSPDKKQLLETKEFKEVKIDVIIGVENDSELMKTEIISHLRAIKRYNSC